MDFWFFFSMLAVLISGVLWCFFLLGFWLGELFGFLFRLEMMSESGYIVCFSFGRERGDGGSGITRAVAFRDGVFGLFLWLLAFGFWLFPLAFTFRK